MYTKDADHRRVAPPPCGSRGRKGKETKDAGGPAIRTRVASFSGTGYVAEREGDELVVYIVSGDPVSTMTVGDGFDRFNRATSAKIAEIQKRNEAARGH